MLGAIAGDIIGSRFEWNNCKSTTFELFTPECSFTDDTVHTVALADALLHGSDYGTELRRYFARYPDAGYGERFRTWASGKSTTPYNSFGNGSAMRVSPVAWFHDSLAAVLEAAERSAAVTHNHPEGIRGARAVAGAIFLARKGGSRAAISIWIQQECGYDLSLSCDEIRPNYRFDVTCQGTVPAAATAFLESVDFEHCVRLAVSLGGDSDTLTCISASIAEAFYGGVPAPIARSAWSYLDAPLQEVTSTFFTTTGRSLPLTPC